MPRTAILAATVLLSTGAAFAGPSAPQVVFELDVQYAKGTFSRATKWLGLFCDGARCELNNARVRVASGRVKNLDDVYEPIDVLEPEGGPVALLSGTTLAAGKVDTWYRPPGTPQESAAYSQLRALGRWALPGGATPLTISWVKLPDDQGFRYHLGDGVRKQFLFATHLQGDYNDNLTPGILWVGDLDHDGKMDMIVSVSDVCKYDQRLYLSSLAKPGDFVGRAARLAGDATACGC